MDIRHTSYAELCNLVQTGDVVCFRGDGPVSTFIKLLTWSPYSHVAVIIEPDGANAMVLESTSLGSGFRGVRKSSLQQRIKDYKGAVAVGLLSDEARAKFTAGLALTFAKKCEGKPYDTRGTILAWFGRLLRIPGKERLDALFCSELCDAFHRAGGLCVGENHNPVPADLVARPIFKGFWTVKEDLA